MWLHSERIFSSMFVHNNFIAYCLNFQSHAFPPTIMCILVFFFIIFILNNFWAVVLIRCQPNSHGFPLSYCYNQYTWTNKNHDDCTETQSILAFCCHKISIQLVCLHVSAAADTVSHTKTNLIKNLFSIHNFQVNSHNTCWSSVQEK